MAYELTDKELAKGLFGGSDYGSSVRILARSPTHVLFNALGSRIWCRKSESWHGVVSLTRTRATRATFEDVANQREIDKAFGEGAAVAVLTAFRTGKTVLFEGGGEKLVEPGLLIAKRHAALYAEKSCSASVDLTGRVPTCRQCGKALTPHVMVHHMGKTILPDHPRSIEDCQRLTNRPVIAIHSYDTRYPDRLGYVDWFETWDGESTLDPYFCSDKCAAVYGRRAAAELPNLGAGPAPARPRHEFESQNHYPEPEPMYVDGPSGRIRIR